MTSAPQNLAKTATYSAKPHESNQMERIAFLDGIRGWASVVVLLSHVVPCFLGSKYPILTSSWLTCLSDGNLAVSVFFVLSGIALTINYFRTRDTKILLHLAVRRYPRLLIPIATSTLIGVALFNGALFFNHEAAPLLQNTWWLNNHFSDKRNFHEIFYFITSEVFFQKQHPWGFNINLWTMHYEFIGSFVVFSFCLLVSPLSRSLLVSLVVLSVAYTFDFYIPFIAGVILAKYTHRLLMLPKKSKLSDCACQIVSFFFLAGVVYYSTFSRNLPFDVPTLPRNDLYGTLAACLVIVSVCINKHLRSLLAAPLSNLLGRISFPLYLTHLFVICSLSCYIALQLPSLDGILPMVILLVASVAASLLVAWFFLPVERVAVTFSRRLSKFIV
jgi:peptidoglycan/LPS O-acetylase OafA/YrhL